ncbi:MAG: hypothetical protein MK005_13975 [Alcanivorax sp.]|nr:hypothetical protein [Alcanivorax sp.]
MNDNKKVRDAGIRSAIIVDDGYDEVPQVSELIDEEAWDIFFDDTYGEAVETVAGVFPGFHPDRRDELRYSQGFVDALWQNRADLGDLVRELFYNYEQKIGETRTFLEKVESELTSLGISFERCGREFVDAATGVDLIVIDLFLGIQQGVRDREFTVERLRQVLERREMQSLPSIILMSQVPGIDELAKQFRQDVKLHASSFRHIRKNDLSTSGRMKGLILTLASHRADSQALATFLKTWEDSAVEAARAAANTLRKVDIDDLQHIRNMLLRFEGVNTSSYILDVFDRVLQYEIESYKAVLDAAAPLDKVAEDPAPLMISNDRDTYAVLERTIFVNPERRNHGSGAEWPIAFGDILGPRAGRPIAPRGFFSGRGDLVFFVASPACDLLRKDGLKTALLVAGRLKKIDAPKPDLAVNANTTPIVVLDGDKRFHIDWHFGDLRTISLGQAKRLLNPARGSMDIIARLREGSALNLRQQLISSVGRVGDLAPLPRSFCFRASFYAPQKGGGVKLIEIPNRIRITGNLLIPRRGKYAAAIIDSSCEDDLTAALLDMSLDDVAQPSKRFFQLLKEQTRIRQIFRSGFQAFELPLDKPRKAGLLKLSEEQPDKDDAKPKVDTVATIVESKISPSAISDVARCGLIVQMELDPDE